MNLHDALYIYEHKVLPTNFFNFKGDFVATILKRKEVLYKVFDGMLAEEGISNPYTEEHFRVDVLRSDAELMVLKITFPEPDDQPLCYYSYLFIDKELEKLRYFGVERGTGLGGVQKYLCSWTPDGEHLNHGVYDPDENKGYRKCLTIYENN